MMLFFVNLFLIEVVDQYECCVEVC